MNPPDRAADARLALLADYAFDMYASSPLTLEPPPDPRLAPQWMLKAYIIGLDTLFRSSAPVETGPGRVCYGYVAESVAQPGKFVAAIRGTANPIEWIEDLEGELVSSGWGGKVEAGFWGVYGSFAMRKPGGMDEPFIPALSGMVGSGSLTVVGHSLGSALSTIAAFQVSPAIGGRVALRVYASPHPGDHDFVTAAAAAVPDHVHYQNILDIVPRLPPVSFGYAALPNTVELEPRTGLVRIKFGPACLHHIESYIALLDPDCLAGEVLPIDQDNTACIVYLSPGSLLSNGAS